MAEGFIIGAIALVVVIIIVSILNDNYINNKPQYIFMEPHKSKVDELAEIKAEIELRENYIYKQPTFAGWHLGKKIKFNDPRLSELLSDKRFCRASGTWVKKGKK